MTKRSLRIGVGALVLGCAVSVMLAGCGKKEDEKKAESTKTEPKNPPGDRYADGKRLEKELSDWKKRWADVAPLADCTPVLTKPEELELCKSAVTAQAGLQAAVAQGEKPEVLAKLGAESALAIERVLEVVRPLSLAELGKGSSVSPDAKTPGAKPADAKPADAKPAPTAPAATGTAAKAPEKDGAAPSKESARPPESPLQQLMRGYTRAGRMTLRFVGRILQVGPLPVRKATASELEKISQGHPEWSALGRTFGDAARSESDAELKAKLRELTGRFSRRPGIGMPPGHPGLPPGVRPGAGRPVPGNGPSQGGPSQGPAPSSPAPAPASPAPAAPH